MPRLLVPDNSSVGEGRGGGGAGQGVFVVLSLKSCGGIVAALFSVVLDYIYYMNDFLVYFYSFCLFTAMSL
jgi:hypothetical protein